MRDRQICGAVPAHRADEPLEGSGGHSCEECWARFWRNCRDPPYAENNRPAEQFGQYGAFGRFNLYWSQRIHFVSDFVNHPRISASLRSVIDVTRMNPSEACNRKMVIYFLHGKSPCVESNLKAEYTGCCIYSPACARVLWCRGKQRWPIPGRRPTDVRPYSPARRARFSRERRRLRRLWAGTRAISKRSGVSVVE